MHLHRLSIARTFVFILCSAGVLAALAQTTLPPRDPEAATRAAREADNPMRVIIEASKLKQRIKPEGDGFEPAPSEKRVPRAAKPASAAAPVAKGPVPSAVEAAKPVPPLPAATAPTLVEKATPPAMASAASAPPVPVLAKAAESMPTALGTPAPVLPLPKTPVLPAMPLKLAQLVEPSLSSAVMRRMSNDVEVVVGFTVNADGTVSDVAVRSSPLKALEAAVVEAVSQWRYEPIREARAHAVQLVLRAAR